MKEKILKMLEARRDELENEYCRETDENISNWKLCIFYCMHEFENIIKEIKKMEE